MDAETHKIPPGKQKRRGISVGIRWGSGGWEADAYNYSCTPPAVLLK
jgi:hypothetical protein